MERDEHREKAEQFIAEVEREFPTKETRRPLSEALYTFSELGLWKMDIDIKEVEEAVRVWAVVETIRRQKAFPKELRM
jgi:hypothetical protein